MRYTRILGFCNRLYRNSTFAFGRLARGICVCRSLFPGIPGCFLSFGCIVSAFCTNCLFLFSFENEIGHFGRCIRGNLGWRKGCYLGIIECLDFLIWTGRLHGGLEGFVHGGIVLYRRGRLSL